MCEEEQKRRDYSDDNSTAIYIEEESHLLEKLLLKLRIAYWTIRCIHRHKWTITREEPNSMRPNEMIELERVCSDCLKHQTNLWGYWLTTELSYEEIQKRIYEG